MERSIEIVEKIRIEKWKVESGIVLEYKINDVIFKNITITSFNVNGTPRKPGSGKKNIPDLYKWIKENKPINRLILFSNYQSSIR